MYQAAPGLARWPFNQRHIGNMPRTPSLDALRIFVVAARHLSFTEAANQLNLTQSAVSHRIRGLEEELGLSLFNRLTRRLERLRKAAPWPTE